MHLSKIPHFHNKSRKPHNILPYTYLLNECLLSFISTAASILSLTSHIFIISNLIIKGKIDIRWRMMLVFLHFYITSLVSEDSFIILAST